MRYKREREITTDTTYYSRKKKNKNKKMKKDRLDLGTPLVKQNKKVPMFLFAICMLSEFIQVDCS